MGFFLLILYLTVSYLSPDQIYPELAQYRIVLCIAIAAGLASIPLLLRQQSILSVPQTTPLLGLVGAMMLSPLAHLWFGGVLFTLETFVPALVVFFLICIHVNRWNRLRILALVMSSIAFLLLGHALWDLYAGNLNSPYLFNMNLGMGQSRFSIVRIRAVGYLADPNDFAQFLIVILPLFALLRKNGRKIRNFVLLIVPSCLVIYGIYLTHSRGAMIALLVLAIFITRNRLPLPVSIGLSGMLYAGMMALGFTGGRDVSIASGSDRIDLWGTGLHLFRLSPLWGVGYGKFGDYSVMTAHNSYVLCLAEVGLIGYTCWLAALIITILQLNSMASAPMESGQDQETMADPLANIPFLTNSPLHSNGMAHDTTDPHEATDDRERVRRWANALRLSLIGFLVTAWFLSRTYTITLYLLLGMTAVLLRLAKDSPEQSKQRRRHWIRITLAAEFATIVAVYAIVRLEGLFIH